MIDIIAMVFSIAGSVLLASKHKYNKKELIIFLLYLVANILFTIYGFFINSIGIIGLNIVYLIISIKGIYKNVKKND